MAELPTGTVTFLFTDVEGSTRLWEEHPDAMHVALARLGALGDAVVAAHAGGVVLARGEGDSHFAVFARATDAVAAAVTLQRALGAEPWPTPTPLRVRLALHTGEADLREGSYYGLAVNRCARLRAIAHGEQVLVSQTTHDLVRQALPDGVGLRDLGEHRLADLIIPERIFQATHPALPADFPPLRSLDAYPHNLPLQLTTFVGRQRELADLAAQLAASRLVTLTGSGGCGKTRLALQPAGGLVDQYADGVWLAELAPLSDASLLDGTVAAALGVREAPGQPIQATLLSHLRSRQLLLILDNCEHLIEACARLADLILRGCPGVRILATSREALGIAGEVSWRVPSLSLPPADQPTTLAEAIGSEAIALFVERAQAVRPGFALTEDNAALVAQICRRLDGIPLALELAAARVRMLPLDEIAARLDESFRLLTGGSRVALLRQQTLRATVDWSYDLLTDAERTLFSRLAVFASGFTLAAAEAVCGDRSLPDVLDLLTHLLDRSLVEADPPARGPGRYRLLETLRQYAWGRLIEAGEMETFRARHAAYYQALGALAIPELHGPKRKDGLDQLEREHDNLRTVLRFLLDRRDVDALSRLCEALGQLWMVRGHIDEGRAWLAEILKLVEASGRAQDHARLLRYDARLAHKQGNWTDAVTRMNQGLAIWRELGDREGMAGELGRLGLANRAHGDFAAARSLFEESLHLYRDLGLEEEVAKQLDRLGVTAFYQGDDATACTLLAESLTIRRRLNDPFWLGWALLVAGMVAHGQGNHAAARSWLDEALTTWRELGYREGVAIALGDLGDLLLDLGDLTAARSALTESLLLWRDVGGYLAIVEHDLECFGGLAAAQGEVQRALRLWGTAAALRERLGEPLPPDFKARRERRLAPIKESLSADAFRQGWAEGQTKTLEQAVAYALEEVRE